MNNEVNGQAKEPTIMENMIQGVSVTTDEIISANKKLELLLTKLRGDTIPPGEQPPKKEPDDSHFGMLGYQLRLQTEFLNCLHKQIDELTTLI
jgi:hypothetical protein